MSFYNILALGDVVGMSACEYLRQNLWNFIDRNNISFTVINGENSADGNGILPQSAEMLFKAGADVITGGNHSFRRREVYNYLDDNTNCIRPANMPGGTPGVGHTLIDANGKRVLVINVLGTVYMEPLESPFDCVERILKDNAGKFDISIVDIHAEATSEKAALARYFDGRVNVVFGTHTHVATADEQVLPLGTGFVTDLGMSGVHDSILGVRSEIIIEKFRTHMPVRFEQAKGDIKAEGVLFSIDTTSGKCVSAKRVSI